MTDSELLADTNRLLRRLVEIDEEQRAHAERSRIEFDEKMAKMSAKRDAEMKAQLLEKGLSPEEIDVPEGEWLARQKMALKKSQENLELMRQKDEAYKEQLLNELQTQSNLLREIAGKLKK